MSGCCGNASGLCDTGNRTTATAIAATAVTTSAATGRRFGSSGGVCRRMRAPSTAAITHTPSTPATSGTGPHGTPAAELMAAIRTTEVVDRAGASARAGSQGARRSRAAIRPGRKTRISATSTSGMASGHVVVPGSSNGVCPAGLRQLADHWPGGHGQVLGSPPYGTRARGLICLGPSAAKASPIRHWRSSASTPASLVRGACASSCAPRPVGSVPW